MSGVSRGRRGRSRNPARDAATQSRANCATPATGTAQISQVPKSPPTQLAVNMEATRMTFRSTGAAAAATNRPVALSTPESSAASEMKRI